MNNPWESKSYNPEGDKEKLDGLIREIQEAAKNLGFQENELMQESHAKYVENPDHAWESGAAWLNEALRLADELGGTPEGERFRLGLRIAQVLLYWEVGNEDSFYDEVWGPEGEPPDASSGLLATMGNLEKVDAFKGYDLVALSNKIREFLNSI